MTKTTGATVHDYLYDLDGNMVTEITPSQTQSSSPARITWKSRPLWLRAMVMNARVFAAVDSLRFDAAAVLFLALIQLVLGRTYYPQLRLEARYWQPSWLYWVFFRVSIFFGFLAIVNLVRNLFQGIPYGAKWKTPPIWTWRRIDPIGIGLFVAAIYVIGLGRP